MRRPVMLAVLTLALFGCGKKSARNTVPDSDPPPPTTKPTTPHVSSNGDKPTNPNQSGNLTVGHGAGGVQAPRMAAARTINQAQLRDLHLSLSQSWLTDMRLPTKDEIMAEARRNPQLLPLLTDEVIILTGAKRGDEVWAYTQYPQRANEHYVVTQEGVVPMSPDDLLKRLTLEKAPIKMGK